MLRSIIFSLSVIVLLAACQSDSASGVETQTPSGFKVIQFNDTEGVTPQSGEYAYFQVVMSNGDSVTYDSRDQSRIPQVIIPTEESMARTKPSPVIEALMMMSVGDSVQLYYPIDSLGGRVPPGYENAENIIYNLALVDIQSAEEYQAAQDATRRENASKMEAVKVEVDQVVSQYAAGELGEKIQTTASGLKYMIVEEGTGSLPQAGQMVFANYYGTLTDGSMFDNSFSRGQPFSFPLGQGRVIRGWDEGFALLKPGAKGYLFIPSELGYGKAGSPPSIPGDAELFFYVEMIEAR